MRVAFALALTFACASALPVSPHQLNAYAPYWRPPTSRHGLTSPSIADCPPQICDTSPDDLRNRERPSDPAELVELPSIKSVKRIKNVYKTGWTMGGMPFSVLYMNPKPQISVRSPVAEPLHAPPPLPPQPYDTEPPQRDQPADFPERFRQIPQPPFPQDSYGPDLRTRILASAPPPSRRQYSIIPQLFVSYGWGPTGK